MTICIPDDSIKTIKLEELDPDWKDTPVSMVTRLIGNAWIENKESLVPAVPSVLNPYEMNYLINPAHPRFNEVKIEKIEDWILDDRLIQKGDT